jgi:hypothetical protein
MDPRIVDLSTSWRRMVSFTSRPIYPRGKSPRYPLDRSWVDHITGLHDVKRRKILNLARLELRLLGHPAQANRYNDCAIPTPYIMMYIIRKAERKAYVV